MKPKSRRGMTLAVIALLLFTTVACNKLRARDQLNKGVQAYKNGRYEQSVEQFKNAVALDPSLLTARLYLATAYAQQYIPGANTPDNNRNAEQAINEFQKVVQANPDSKQKVLSLKGIASLYLKMKKLDLAQQYYEQVLALDSKDAETYYNLAAIQWNLAYQLRMEARAKLGLQPTEPLKDRSVCEQLRAANLAKIEDGQNKLEKALELRPDYEDAMASMNLLYREKADLECGNPAARTANLKAADDWMAKALATKKSKAERAAAGTIAREQQSE